MIDDPETFSVIPKSAIPKWRPRAKSDDPEIPKIDDGNEWFWEELHLKTVFSLSWVVLEQFRGTTRPLNCCPNCSWASVEKNTELFFFGPCLSTSVMFLI